MCVHVGSLGDTDLMTIETGIEIEIEIETRIGRCRWWSGVQQQKSCHDYQSDGEPQSGSKESCLLVSIRATDGLNSSHLISSHFLSCPLL